MAYNNLGYSVRLPWVSVPHAWENPEALARSRVIDDARREDSAAAETMDRPYVFGEGLRAVRAFQGTKVLMGDV